MTHPNASMQATDATKCRATNKNGRPCSAPPLEHSQWCAFHDPDPIRQEAARIIRSLGGSARSRPQPPGDPVSLATPQDRRLTVERAINELRSGAINQSIAKLMVYGASVVSAARVVDALEERLAALERGLSAGQEERAPLPLHPWESNGTSSTQE